MIRTLLKLTFTGFTISLLGSFILQRNQSWAILSSDYLTYIIFLVVIVAKYLFIPVFYSKLSHSISIIELKNPGIDFSNSAGIASAIASSSVLLGSALVADASGFGVFMASASALGSIGASFTTIHTCMSILGTLLNPMVYIPFSLATGLGMFSLFSKSGNKLLNESIEALNKDNYQKAYEKAFHASQKGIRKPKRAKIDLWQNTINIKIDHNRTLIYNLTNLADDVMNYPEFIMLKGLLVGVSITLAVLWWFKPSTVSHWGIAFIATSIGIVFSEIKLYFATVTVAIQLPLLKNKVATLCQIRENIVF